jgi:sialate O-acetylesterase
MASLPPTAASFAPVDIVATTAGGRTVRLRQVLFGDVWVCSGQSNMEYAIGGVNNSAAAVAEMANYSESIRLFHVGHAKAGSPQPEVR